MINKIREGRETKGPRSGPRMRRPRIMIPVQACSLQKQQSRVCIGETGRKNEKKKKRWPPTLQIG